MNNNLDCLIWLKSNGCPWDNSLFKNASEECAKWARENGCF
jgi:hypothetical protein